MGWLFARFYDRFTRAAEEAGIQKWRRELLGRVRGRVLEIGAGTGWNLPLYPEEGIDELVVTEPDPHMLARLRARAGELGRETLQLHQAGAEDLPVADGSQDWVVSTLVLCTVPDLPASLREIWRVLRPGGRLLFLEHVAWDERARYRWQRLFEPLWRFWAQGCRLTRRTGEAIVRAGFCIDELVEAPMPKAPPIVRRTLRGVAVKPGGGEGPANARRSS